MQAYLLRPNTTVIGSVRNSSSMESAFVKPSSYPTARGSRLILTKIDFNDLAAPAKAIASVASAYEITHIDVVIANAGMSPTPTAFAETPIDDVMEAMKINAVAPFALFKAIRPLLEKAPRPVWVSMSSAAGSMTTLEQSQVHWICGYGASKAALNWLTMGVHAACGKIVAFMLHPG